MRGFSLIEIIITLAVLSILASISLGAYQLFAVKSELEISAGTVVQALRQAQFSAQAMENDSAWGVKFENGKITVFSGTSFGSRDSAKDKVLGLAKNINFGSITEVVFNKFSGQVTMPGSISISNKSGTKTITYNAQGIISY